MAADEIDASLRQDVHERIAELDELVARFSETSKACSCRAIDTLL